MKNIRLSPLVSAILLTGYSSVTFAALGQNLSVDIRSLAMGNAVTADPPGISAIHFNPAALTKIEGLQTDVQGILADFNIEREFSVPQVITCLAIQMIRLFVMMGLKLMPISVPTLKGQSAVMLNTRAYMSLV